MPIRWGGWNLVSSARSAGSSFAAAAGPATPAMVQHVSLSNNVTSSGAPATSNGFKVNLPNDVGSGNLLRRTFGYPHGLTATVGDDNGNNWTKVISVDPGAFANSIISEYWIAKNCNAGPTHVTVTLSSGSSVFIGGDLTEFTNVDTVSPVDGSIGTALVAAPNLATGSFTPTTNNDANGGHLIDCYFACSNSQSADNPSKFTPGGSFKLLDADISFVGSGGSPRAHQYFVQTANAAINPSVTATGSTENYNCIAVALKAANAGTARPAGMRIVKLLHYTMNGTGNVPLQVPMDGNLAIITLPTDNYTFTGLTDTDSGTWQDPTFGEHHMLYLDAAHGAGVSNSKVATVAGSAAFNLTFSLRFVDIQGAANAPVDGTGDVEAQNGGSKKTIAATNYTDAPTIAPSSNGPGLVFAIEYAVTGPCLAVGTGGVSATYDAMTYTNETDVDSIENSDGLMHFPYSSTATLHCNWTVGALSVGSGAWGGAIAFKAA